MIKRLMLLLGVAVVLSFLVITPSAFSAGATQVYLRRGKDRETIQCPLVADGTYIVDSIRAAFWYKGHIEKELLISYVEGQVYTNSSGRQIQEDKYNITAELSLVIYDIKDSDGGHYVCKLRPKRQPYHTSHVNATVVVLPGKPALKIERCHKICNCQKECVIEVPPEEFTYNLTCLVTNARPRVKVRWLKVLANGATEDVAAQITRVIPGTEKLLFTSSATMTEAYQGETTWRCYAFGIAMGSDNGSYADVNVTRLQTFDTTTPRDHFVTTTPVDTVDISISKSKTFLILCIFLAFGILVIVSITIKKHSGRNPGNEGSDTEMGNLIDPELSSGDAMRLFVDQLKAYYEREMNSIPVHPVLLYLAKKIQNIYINLHLFKETGERFKAQKAVRLKGWSRAFYPEEAKKVPLESHEELMKLLRDSGRVVVMGTAGRGKTTLTRKIAYDWTCLTDPSVALVGFKFVFVLRMKEIQGSSGILEAIRRILPMDSKLTRKHLLQLITENQKEVLFVLDGWDEASSHIMESQPQHQGDISLKDVLSFKAFVNCSVLVTTRPHKTTLLQEYYSNFTIVETTGFSDKNRNEYIRQYYSEEPSMGEALIKEVPTTAFIHTLSQSPIMLLLLCLIWSDEQTLPYRITELYQRAVKVLIQHFSCKFDNHEQDQNKINLLKDEIGLVAFEGLIDPQGERLVFTPDEFPKTLNYGLQIGVLYQESKAVAEMVARMVNFLHKSFQEFFAAHFLTSTKKNLVTKKLLPLITVNTIQEKEYLLRFCCGMDSGCAKLIVQHVKELKEELQTPVYLWIQMFTLTLVFEAQSTDLVAAVGSRITLKYKEDFPAFYYYLQHNPHKVELDRLNIHLTLVPDQTIARRILDVVTVHSLYFHAEFSDHFEKLLSALSETISKLQHLPKVTRLYVKVTFEYASTCGSTAINTQLHQLCKFITKQSSVSGFGVGLDGPILQLDADFKDLMQALSACKAVYLCIENNDIQGFLGDLHISPVNRHLTSVVLRNCSLRDADLNDVTAFLKKANGFNSVYLERATFSLDALKVFVAAVKDQMASNMERLYLNEVGLSPSDVSDLVKETLPNLNEFKPGFFTPKTDA